MFVYWKKLIPFFSKHTYNTRQLLRKDVRFNWSRECQAELDYLKKCLLSDPVLKPLDPNENLIISVDGSSHGLGFCVLQADDDNQLHAVKYGSFATTPQQANYSAERNTVNESAESQIVTDETDVNDESPIEFPVISPADFETDEEFGNMYRYLTREELTGHSRTDKTTLIMADRYIIETGLLYRIDVPRQKRLSWYVNSI